jgi:peptide-methionine (S)-S-oxide reductase
MTTASESKNGLETATLAGGCFWCLEAAFEQLQGVQKVESGYAGGAVTNPSYKQVCTGTTGHAEVVQITFDPKIISYDDLLTVFFAIHDPTTLNRQGADFGTQYRSAIYYHSPEQKAAAEKAIAEQRGQWPNPVVTEVKEAPTFYKAEDYHQGYYQANPHQGYCMAVVGPKAAKVRKLFASKLKGS